MASLVQPDAQDVAAFTDRYQPPSVEEIDPSFIHMHPAVMERSDFDALRTTTSPSSPASSTPSTTGATRRRRSRPPTSSSTPSATGSAVSRPTTTGSST